MIEIKHRITGNVLKTVNADSLQGADLRWADLQGADLQGADLRGADLQKANLQKANLREANLQKANLQWADLQGADLRGADLRGADLRGADLQGADLREANLDFSVWPLWCGSFHVKADDRLVYQLLAHVARLDVGGCSPWVRYLHRTICGTWDADNGFCKYRKDVEPITIKYC